MKKCFVIMPFSKTTDAHTEQYWDSFFSLIKTQVEKKNYLCERSESGPYNILTNIINNLNESDIVIAVLTDLNANVFYELGIRHSLKNGTILLMEKGQRLPFDLSSYGAVLYDDDIMLHKKLEEILNHISIIENREDLIDSPVKTAIKNNKSSEDKISKLYEFILEITKENNLNHTSPKQKELTHRVLWVDDYPSNNVYILEMFENRDIKFDLALNTHNAINMIKEYKYDLIITDMGRGNAPDAGLELIKEIKEKQMTDAPIIVCASQQAINKYGKEAVKLGALDAINGYTSIINYINGIYYDKKIEKINIG